MWGDFKTEEMRELEDRTRYPTLPSIQSPVSWRDYIIHRLRMARRSIAIFTSLRYTRMLGDKYVTTTRAVDKIANRIIHNKPAIVFMGNAEMSSNSPIGIRKNQRCPGARRLLKSWEKRDDVIVIPVDEYMTSQYCGRCFKRFPLWTRPKRMKVCVDCKPIAQAQPAPIIVTRKSKRKLQIERRDKRNSGTQAVQPRVSIR